MKTKFLIVFFLWAASLEISFSQQSNNDFGGIQYELLMDTVLADNQKNIEFKPCIAPFVELVGKGFISLNLDYRPKEHYAFSFGIQPMEGISPNIMFYYLTGKRHRIEIGGGISGGFSKSASLEVVLLHGVIGLRFQKKKAFFLRIGFTPLYVMFLNDPDRDNMFYPLAGLSIGYSF